MWSLETFIAATILGALVAYALTGGADFGGGVWDLLATGPRAKAQRDTIAHALAPIWEANHVWLIAAFVLLFVAFPVAFAAITTTLHIPLLLMLVGIVLRGSAFIFRAYDTPEPDRQRRWSILFAVTSTMTPLALGVAVGSIVGEGVRVPSSMGRFEGGADGLSPVEVVPPAPDFISAWLSPFPMVVGVFVVLLFAYLAAVYLVLETDDDALRDDFRRRALATSALCGVAAALGLWEASREGLTLAVRLTQSSWSLAFQAVTALAALAAFAALWRRRFELARALAMLQVTCVVLGLGAGLFPMFLPPDLSVAAAAAPQSTLRALSVAVVAGGLVVTPAFVYLYTVFKGRRPSAPLAAPQPDA